MGLLWDLVQQHQIGQQLSKAGSLEERIEDLERDTTVSRQIIEQMAKKIDELEDRIGATNG